ETPTTETPTTETPAPETQSHADTEWAENTATETNQPAAEQLAVEQPAETQPDTVMKVGQPEGGVPEGQVMQAGQPEGGVTEATSEPAPKPEPASEPVPESKPVPESEPAPEPAQEPEPAVKETEAPPPGEPEPTSVIQGGGTILNRPRDDELPPEQPQQQPTEGQPVAEAKAGGTLDQLVVPDDGQAFKLDNGVALHGVKELREYLPQMSDEEFDKHVGLDYNHFADWISGVFQNEDLARRVGTARSKEEMVAALSG
ncbi:hypothetical protein GOV07_05960, partial [Candidatus Woesearchaeota archaeon]|nr:hypothetical protein [Candidatus Woesearchaeota archaeon]